MFIGSDFPPFEDQVGRLLGTDVTLLLMADETITALTSRLRTVKGTDNLPQNHLPVAPQFSGAQMSQLVVFDDPSAYWDPRSLVGNEYMLSFSATTTLGRVLMPWSRFTIRPGPGVTGYPGGTPPGTARSVMIPVQPLYYTLPILGGGQAAQDFPPANQGETLLYGLDFAVALSPGEVITSASSFLAVFDGTDAAVSNNASVYDVGAISIDGSTISRMLRWPPAPDLTANVYALNLTAVTSFNQSIAAWSRIVINRPA